jgi:hypothetical protein
MDLESKEYSWARVTANRLLSHGPCELAYAHMEAGTADDYVTLYDGESTLGEPLTVIRAATKTSRPFSPKVPVYCRRGLYITISTATAIVFVQWRELGHKAGG